MSGSVMRLFKVGLLTVAVVALFAGCAGKDGKDGINGTNGSNGADGTQGPTGPNGTAECMQCHTDDFNAADYIRPFEQEYFLSKHGTGDTFSERNKPCSGCHTTEGFAHRVAAGADTFTIGSSSRIGCFACHAPHTNKSFAQRVSDTNPVQFSYAPTAGGTYNKGVSNTCATCHQARVPNPLPTTSPADSTIKSSRWGVHHGPQSNYLAGYGAAPITGYTYASAHQHYTANNDGCVKCHMGATISGQDIGGHTFEVAYLSNGTLNINHLNCNDGSCHPSWTNNSGANSPGGAVAADSVAYGASMDSLKAILVGKGWINDSTDLVNASSAHPLSIADANYRAVLFNYVFLGVDRPSGGIHNKNYEWSILRACIDYMQANP